MRRTIITCSFLLGCAHRPSLDERIDAIVEEGKQESAESAARYRREDQEKKNERSTGQIVSKESMGKKATVLEGMIVPVNPGNSTSAVYTLAVRFVRMDDAPDVVHALFSPYFIESGLGLYLDCHRVGLWRDTAWTTVEAKEGSDGWWVVVEGEHDLGAGGSHRDEVVATTFPVTVLSELVATEHAGAQVCEDKFELSVEQKALLQEFLAGPRPAGE